jgi:hypothetical protein
MNLIRSKIIEAKQPEIILAIPRLVKIAPITLTIIPAPLDLRSTYSSNTDTSNSQDK